MPLDPAIRAALDAAAHRPALESLPLAEARAVAKARYAPSGPPPAVARVHDIAMATDGRNAPLRARVYVPEGRGPFPLVAFFHGSGFVLLDLDTHDAVCRRLCRSSGAIVVSVDYRLAPEHPFPAAPDDGAAATRWLAAHGAALDGDPARLAVAGDSAGACLAAATALRLRDDGGPRLAAQLHFYPVLDYPGLPTGSLAAFAQGFGLTLACLRWYWSQYLPDRALASHPYAVPLAAESFAGLPPALIITAEYDVLRDEGERYGMRLAAAGVDARIERCAGMNHGFLKYDSRLAAATRALDGAGAWLAQRLA